MMNETVLGTHEKTQRKAAEILTDTDGELTYTELREKLNVTESVMQAVIRGLHDNGVLKTVTRNTGERVYTTRKNIQIQQIYGCR